MAPRTTPYRFHNTCVGWNRDDVDRPGGLCDLVANARDISRARFLRLVDRQDRIEMERALGYTSHPRAPGLHITQDYHVVYKTGRLHGRHVAFLVHSAIEHVFVPEGFHTPA